MSEKQELDAMVKLTTEEIARLVKSYIDIVEVIATKFDGRYLDMEVRVSDYREMLDEMDTNLKRAEEFIKIINEGEE